MCGREGEQTTHLKGGSVGVSSVLRAGYLKPKRTRAPEASGWNHVLSLQALVQHGLDRRHALFLLFNQCIVAKDIVVDYVD